MKFRKYMITNYINADNAKGDFARDIELDKDFPKSQTFTRILNHLEKQGAIDRCIDTFRECWAEYSLTVQE